MKQSLMKKFALATLPLVLAGTLAGCMTTQEIARYNSLMDETVAQSTASRPTGDDAAQRSSQAYKERLRFALKSTLPSVLEKIHESNAIIRLDSRLAHMTHDFFEYTPYMGYYNDGNQIIITILDTGSINTRFRIQGQSFDPDTIASGLNELFRWNLEGKDLSVPDVKFGFLRPDACGKERCETVVWGDASSYSKVIAKNPSLNLMQPPTEP